MLAMQDFTVWDQKIAELEERLRPIADRPVDITKPGWLTLLRHSPHPLDEAAARPEVESLLSEMIVEYQKCGEESRAAIRKLFEKHSAFAWAAALPFAPVTEEYFRRHMVLFSMKDLGRDTRDAILWLKDLCQTATAAGVNTAPILRQIAELSSHQNRHGMGSARSLLLKAG
jgi:hypothetical protein